MKKKQDKDAYRFNQELICLEEKTRKRCVWGSSKANKFRIKPLGIIIITYRDVGGSAVKVDCGGVLQGVSNGARVKCGDEGWREGGRGVCVGVGGQDALEAAEGIDRVIEGWVRCEGGEVPLADSRTAWAVLPRPVASVEFLFVVCDAGVAEGVLRRLHVVQRVLRLVRTAAGAGDDGVERVGNAVDDGEEGRSLGLVGRVLGVKGRGSVKELVLPQLDGGAEPGLDVV